MAEDILKELWVHSVCDFEPECVDAILSVFENADNAFNSVAVNGERIKKLGIPKRFIRESANEKHIKISENILEYCNKKGIRILTIRSEEYPDCLRNVDLPPRILFVWGRKLNLDNEIGVSVVGCRKCTLQGVNIAGQIGYNLARNGITVISGMAEGIDAAAHNGALKAEGITIAVLAGGVDDIYPVSNRELYYKILENGTIVSERPPGTKVKKYFYEQRNRIIVGLSQGVVITEGKKKSGTSITSRLATDNNRDVFAVPGNPTVWQSSLPNSMIYDGAAIVDKIDSVTEFYRDMCPEKLKIRDNKEEAENKNLSNLKDEDKKIIEALKENSGVANAEMLAEKCGIPVQKMNGRLTVLCIKGIIKQESGSRFILIKDNILN